MNADTKSNILAIALELYDDNTNTRNTTVKKIQWFDETSGIGRNVRGRRVLVMDEVDMLLHPLRSELNFPKLYDNVFLSSSLSASSSNSSHTETSFFPSEKVQ